MSYLSAETLKQSVDRLGEGSGNSRIADYLMLRRGVIRTRQPDTTSNGALSSEDVIPPPDVVADASADFVVSGIKSAPWVYSVKEIAGASPGDGSEEWEGEPYFNPFGASSDTKARGFRTAKLPSNGPSDTVTRWQGRPFKPVEVVENSKPKAFRVVGGSADELSGFFLDRSDAPKPRLLDAAVWWHRFSDLPDDADADSLVEAFISDVGLERHEVLALFSDERDPIGLSAERASPSSYLPPPTGGIAPPRAVGSSTEVQPEDVQDVIDYIEELGFVFEPWQVAAFVTAVRTKPFVLLAGISGTGKTKLPRLVAQATGAQSEVVPVQASWTDSSDLIGYERLDGFFAPGHLTRSARSAAESVDSHNFFVLDEMNIARVEYYLAEYLSIVEERFRDDNGEIQSAPLAPSAKSATDSDRWSEVSLPSNLSVVGSVNMDETTFGFSRKVLDRAFVIEFSSVDLNVIPERTASPTVPTPWPVSWWTPSHLTLAEVGSQEASPVKATIEALTAINSALEPLGQQVGYRVRDEVALFCLNAEPLRAVFTDRDAAPVDPLDLAITMKVLPRLQGGGEMVRVALDQLLAWAEPGESRKRTFVMSAERLKSMRKRLDQTGFTSFWL